MTQFKTDDAVGIKNYIESLDVFNQFDEITVELLGRDSIDNKQIREVRITVKSLDRVVHRSQTPRNFGEQIFEFSKYFEQDLRFLSAAILFLRRLLEIDRSLTNFRIETKDFWVSAIAYSESSYYEINASIHHEDNDAIATIRHSLEADLGLMKSSHSFEIKSVIKIDELESVVNEFVRLKAALQSKGV